MIKNRLLILLISVVLLTMCSSEENGREDNHDGLYNTWSIVFDSPIDLAGEGVSYTDLLTPLNVYGWHGIQKINEANLTTYPFYHNEIRRESAKECSIVLYLPFPYNNSDKILETPPTEGICNAYVDKYWMRCIIEDGGVRIMEVSDEDFMKSPKLSLSQTDSGRAEMIFEADTFYYDWDSGKYVDGQLKVTMFSAHGPLGTNH